MKSKNWNQYVERFNEQDEELTKQSVPNVCAGAWITAQVPKFECSDPVMEETYYFRWWVFRKHIKATPEGRILTEFLPDVAWAGAYNSINCAAGHHLAEARWMLEDEELSEEYIRFWFRGSGNELSYSSWMIYMVYERALLTGRREEAVGLLEEFDRFYRTVEERNLTRYGLFWSYDDRDAMEMSISGSGLRPTLNSYMYANAYALARIAAWAGAEQLRAVYAQKAAMLRERILGRLWDDRERFFKVIPQRDKDQRITAMEFDRIPQMINVREAIGYIPWNFGIPDERFDEAWKYVMAKEYFYSDFGPVTAAKNHPAYGKACPTHECLWNGPSWPFATTQILNGMIRLLQERDCKWLSKEDFLKTMQVYAASHYRIRADGRKVNWLDENLDPETGQWLSRGILRDWGWPEQKGGYERGKDYNHSAFCDLVIRGICGIMITEELELTVNPLLPDGAWDYFLLEDVPYRQHRITVGYDRDNTRYHMGAGLWVMVDGRLAASAGRLEKLVIA